MTFALEFIESGSSTTSYIGGGSWMPSNLPWPTSSDGKKMIPLMTIYQNTIFTQIPEGMVITVFTPIDLKSKNIILQLSNCSANNQNEYDKNKNGMCVVLHKMGDKELVDESITCYPKVFLKTRNFTDKEEKDESRDDDWIGINLSKMFCIPYWLRDMINEDKDGYGVLLQIREEDLVKGNKLYKGIFNGGICYLSLSGNSYRMTNGRIVGRCFIQFKN
jgi:hypothetical protein